MSAEPIVAPERTLRAAPPAPPHIFDLMLEGPPDPGLASRLEDLKVRFQDKDAREILQIAIREEFPGRITTVSSFGAESVVLLHLMAEIDPSVPVIFLNTGKLFGETLRYRDRLQDRLGLTDIRSIRPTLADEATFDPDGTLWSCNPDLCCNFRKVLPLKRALAPFDAEITGRKRFQTASRKAMAPVELAGSRFKINPLAAWSLDDLNAHMEAHKLPRHPLVADGYLSIGCMPCTQRVKDGDGYRSGRWAGFDKDECGIHDNVGGDGI